MSVRCILLTCCVDVWLRVGGAQSDVAAHGIDGAAAARGRGTVLSLAQTQSRRAPRRYFFWSALLWLMVSLISICVRAFTVGPVVILGVFGPVHAFVRLQSLQLPSSSSSLAGDGLATKGTVGGARHHATSSLWDLPHAVAGSGAGSGDSDAQGANAVSGVLLSSSSRLARALYGLCFERVRLHASLVPFSVVDEEARQA